MFFANNFCEQLMDLLCKCESFYISTGIWSSSEKETDFLAIVF